MRIQLLIFENLRKITGSFWKQSNRRSSVSKMEAIAKASSAPRAQRRSDIDKRVFMSVMVSRFPGTPAGELLKAWEMIVVMKDRELFKISRSSLGKPDPTPRSLVAHVTPEMKTKFAFETKLTLPRDSSV